MTNERKIFYLWLTLVQKIINFLYWLRPNIYGGHKRLHVSISNLRLGSNAKQYLHDTQDIQDESKPEAESIKVILINWANG